MSLEEKGVGMKCKLALFTVAVLLITGCEYESPLTKKHNIAVDSAVLGLWEAIPDKEEEPKQNERMMILKYSGTEYLIHYPVGKDGAYFRGYPIKIGGSVVCSASGHRKGRWPLGRKMRRIFFMLSLIDWRVLDSKSKY